MTLTTTPAPADPSHIYARRRAQLRLLIDQCAAGNIAAFADQLGYSRSRVSQFLSDTYNEGRSIGERAARALEEVVGVPFGWLDQVAPAAADRLVKISETATTDHAAELRSAIAQTRLVFEGSTHAEQALDYLELVMASNIARSCTATMSEIGDAIAKAVSKPPRDNSALAQIKRELFTASNRLQQPADLTVQMMLLAELRGLRAEATSDRFARCAAVLS